MDDLLSRNGHEKHDEESVERAPAMTVMDRPAPRPIRKDERVVADRGLYI